MITYINHLKETVRLNSGMLVPYPNTVRTHHTIDSGWNPNFILQYLNNHSDSLSEREYIVVEYISLRISIMRICETRAEAVEVAKSLGAKKILNAGTSGWEHTSCLGALFQLLTQ